MLWNCLHEGVRWVCREPCGERCCLCEVGKFACSPAAVTVYVR